MNYKSNMGGMNPQRNCQNSMPNNNPNTDCLEVCDQSIFFSGLCDGQNFDISKNYWTELSINGAICVPEQKPLIEQIDSINAKTEIMSIKVIETPGLNNATIENYEGRKLTTRKLIVEGLICLTVSYVSMCKDQSVHSFHGKVPFSAFIVISREIGTGANKKDTLNLNFMVASCIEDVCVKSIQNRVVNVTATFILSATQVANPCDESYFLDSGIECRDVVDCISCEDNQNIVISGVCPPEKIRNLITTNMEKYWNEISVPEVLTIPSFKPDVEQILSINSKVEIMCQKVIETPIATQNRVAPGQVVVANGKNLANLNLTGRKLIIEALLRQRITYVSSTDCQSVHSAHFDIPISTYIMVPQKTLLTDKFKIVPCIEDIYACILNPRQIFKNTTLFFKAVPVTCPLGIAMI